MKKNFIHISFFVLLILSCTKSNDSEIINDDNKSTKEDWYKVTTILNNTYSIEEPKSSQGNVSYLIEGNSKAFMFDTGSGENVGFNGTKIQYQIKELTNLPTTLLLSHFHFDHNQNINEFNNIAFPEISFLKNNTVNNIYTFSSKELFSGSFPSSATVNEWLPINTDIDLGNRIIQLINLPGHTKESIVIIDKTNKLVFLGDYLYNGSLFLFDKNDITVYKQSVDYLISNLDTSYRLFGAHGTPEVSFSKLKELQEVLICIQNDQCTSISQTVWGYNTLFYEYKNMKIRIFL